MPRLRLIAIVLIVAGLFGLVYDRISYVKESHELKIGSLELAVKERETINVPLWCSVVAVAAGVTLLASRRAASR
jgi:hypothetical protein